MDDNREYIPNSQKEEKDSYESQIIDKLTSVEKVIDAAIEKYGDKKLIKTNKNT